VCLLQVRPTVGSPAAASLGGKLLSLFTCFEGLVLPSP
jgi:hypothetical protein